MSSTIESTPINLTILCGTSSSYTLSSTTNIEDAITSSTALSKIKERIALIEDLTELYPIEQQRLYYCNDSNGRHYLPDDNRTLLSYGINGNDVTLYLARSSQRRRLNPTTTAPQPSNESATQQSKVTLLSLRLAEEICNNLKKRQEELDTLMKQAEDINQERETLLQQAQDKVRELNSKKEIIIEEHRALMNEIDTNLDLLRDKKDEFLKLKTQIRAIINEVDEGYNLAKRVQTMSSESSSEYILNKLHHYESFHSLSDLANQSCIICNVDLCKHQIRRGDKPIVKTLCSHLFHRECLKKWMISSNKLSCPLCRGRV